MYKCIDAQGRTTYQGSPCAGQDKSNSQLQVKVSVTRAPLDGTPRNRLDLAQYTAYQAQKVVVEACINGNSPFADQISSAHDNYYEFARESIERGKEVLERGFKDFSSSEMRAVQREAREEQKIELRTMTQMDFNHACSEQVGKFRRMVSGNFNKPTGYQKNYAGVQKSN